SAQIVVADVQLVGIERCKEIEHVQTGIEFDHALPEVDSSVPGSIAHSHEDISACIRRRAGSAHPYATFGSCRSDVPDCNLRQSAGIKSENETFVRINVSVRREGRIDIAVGEQ